MDCSGIDSDMGNDDGERHVEVLTSLEEFWRRVGVTRKRAAGTSTAFINAIAFSVSPRPP